MTAARAARLQRISRRGLISSGVLAGVLAATGMQVQARTRGGVLRLGLSGDATGLHPARHWGAFAQVAGAGAIHDTLTEITATGELVGELAESWTPADAAATWTIALRRGISFHDGREVTAADVAASFAAHDALSPARATLDRIAAVEIAGTHHLRFRLHAPDVNFPLLLADPHLIVAPEGVFDGVGSGLYALAEFVPGERLRLTRVPQHWRDGRAGWFDAVVLRAIPDAAARAAALAAGHVDAVDLPADPAALESRRNLRVIRAEGYGAAFDAPGLAAAQVAGLPVIAGAPAAALHAVHPAHAAAPHAAARFGAGVENLMPAAPAAAVAGHMPYTVAHGDRLRHDDAVGALWPMDGLRIAERWWFA